MTVDEISGSDQIFLIDADPGVDTAMAIVLVAAQPQTRIVAVGSVHGNVPSAVAAQNALRLLDLVGLPDVPVAVGETVPLSREQTWLSGQFVHGEDGLGGHAGPPSTRRLVADSAAEQMARLARANPGHLTLLALGPLTNVALALRAEPELPRLLRRVVWMGGAIDVPGNAGFRQEANAWHDPEAAEEVLRAGFALTIVPMDACNHAWAGARWLDELAESDHPWARWATQVSQQYIEVYTNSVGRGHGERGCVLYDPLAAAIALDPGLITHEERRPVVVELQGHSRGATLVDRRDYVIPGTELPPRPAVRVVIRADAQTMLDRMRDALLRPARGPARSGV
jgi:purine nucleosidase